MTRTRFAVFVGVVAAAFWLVTGTWAFFAPRSFATQIATFVPYSRHLTHDVGAFSIGLGAVLVFGVLRREGLTVSLAGASVAAVFHAVSHFLDSDIGGRSSDPYVLSAFAALCVAGTIASMGVRRARATGTVLSSAGGGI